MAERSSDNSTLTPLARASGAAGSAFIKFQVREAGAPQWRTIIPSQITSSIPLGKDVSGVILDAGTDIRIRVASVSDNDTAVSATWNYDLIAV